MVDPEDRDLVGLCFYVPRRIRTRFIKMTKDHGISARSVLQAYMTQFTAEQARLSAQEVV